MRRKNKKVSHRFLLEMYWSQTQRLTIEEAIDLLEKCFILLTRQQQY